MRIIDESPIDNRKLRSSLYVERKKKKVAKKLIDCVDSVEEIDRSCCDSKIMLSLAEKFKKTNNLKTKYMLLTTAMSSEVDLVKIGTAFNASMGLVYKAKKLFDKKGVLSVPDRKARKKKFLNLKEIVADFFNDDEISRQMPGMNDREIVRHIVDGKVVKIYVQKRMLLASLEDTHKKFLAWNPSIDPSFTLLYMLKPEHIVYPTSSGTLNVCVCIAHENTKLKFDGSKIKELSQNSNIVLLSCEDCVKQIICSEPTDDCYVGLCSQCPGTDTLCENILDNFFNANVTEVTYRYWNPKGRCELTVKTEVVADFVVSFINDLKMYKVHAFVAERQMKGFKIDKESLKDGEVLVICDYSENYTLIFQNEVQAAHWSNIQATVHCSVVYYMEQNVLKHFSHVVISPYLKHDVYGVHLFLTKLISHIKSKIPWPLKLITYYSDGAPSQYKNFKNALNVLNHEQDFGVRCKWKYFASGHGKNACDGVGGSVKGTARRASISAVDEAVITNPKELFLFLRDKMNTVTFDYTEEDEHKKTQKKLDRRYKNSKKVDGIRKIHEISVQDSSNIVTKQHFGSKYSKVYKLL